MNSIWNMEAYEPALPPEYTWAFFGPGQEGAGKLGLSLARPGPIVGFKIQAPARPNGTTGHSQDFSVQPGPAELCMARSTPEKTFGNVKKWNKNLACAPRHF